MVQKLLSNFTFFYSPPVDSNWGGVGIYLSESLTNISILDEAKIKRKCDCSKCQIESFFVEFKYNGMIYSIGGIWKHPNGNVSHFVSDLELLLNELDNGGTTIIAGDVNIDIIKFTNIDVISCMTTMMAYEYLPFITLPSRITQLWTTCIDHIFMKKSHRAKILNTLCGLFYWDHLPSF